MARTNAATAATDSPAICAGVILGLSSAAVATGADVGAAEEVGAGNEEMVSTKADGVELVCVCRFDVIVGVVVATDCIEDGVAVRVALVTT